MIQLTRLRHGERFFLNPDLFERVDTHVDTVIRLIDGTEYVVVEPAEEIVRKIAHFRAQIIAIAGMLQAGTYATSDVEDRVDGHVVVQQPPEIGAAAADAPLVGTSSEDHA